VLDNGKCFELAGDRVMSSLTQYETLLPHLLADLKLALAEASGKGEKKKTTVAEGAHMCREKLNAAVLWSTEWGLEHDALAREAKAAARGLAAELRKEQLAALGAQAEACVAAVTEWDWRAERLGKARFERAVAPPAVDVMDELKVTDCGAQYPAVVSLEKAEEELSNGTRIHTLSYRSIPPPQCVQIHLQAVASHRTVT
jgi:hypothetical protein